MLVVAVRRMAHVPRFFSAVKDQDGIIAVSLVLLTLPANLTKGVLLLAILRVMGITVSVRMGLGIVVRGPLLVVVRDRCPSVMMAPRGVVGAILDKIGIGCTIVIRRRIPPVAVWRVRQAMVVHSMKLLQGHVIIGPTKMVNIPYLTRKLLKVTGTYL